MARTDEDELDETQERAPAKPSVKPRRRRGAAPARTDAPARARRSQRLRAEAAEAQRTGTPPPQKPSGPALDPAITEDDLVSKMPVADGMELDDGGSAPGDTNGSPSSGEPAGVGEPEQRGRRRRPNDGSDDDQPGGDQPGADDPGAKPKPKPKPPPRGRSRNRRHGRR